MRRYGTAWMATRTLVAAAVLSTPSCGGAPKGVVDKCTEQLVLPPSVTTDILFVIDNSDSMAAKQARVAAQLRAFVDSLASGTVHNDFQIGVITTSVSINYLDGCPPITTSQLYQYSAQSGRLQLGTDLGGNLNPASTRKLLSYQDPDLVDQFALLVGQGVNGSGQEMPLEATRRALSPPLIDTGLDAVPPGNRGLLRPGARLLVVVVSDEDDCSDSTGTAVALQPPSCGPACTADSDCTAEGSYCLLIPNTTTRSCAQNACETSAGRAALTPVGSYVEFLKNLDDGTGSGRKREVYLAIIGPVDSTGKPARCHSSTDEAFGSGVRDVQAVTGMGDHGLLSSVCADDYGVAMQQIAALVREPQVLDLPSDPADGRLLVVEIHRPGQPGDGGVGAGDGGVASGQSMDAPSGISDGGAPAGDGGGIDVQPESEIVITCREGDGFTFVHATASTPARITMEGRCRLHFGDQLTVRLFCAE